MKIGVGEFGITKYGGFFTKKQSKSGVRMYLAKTQLLLWYNSTTAEHCLLSILRNNSSISAIFVLEKNRIFILTKIHEQTNFSCVSPPEVQIVT